MGSTGKQEYEVRTTQYEPGLRVDVGIGRAKLLLASIVAEPENMAVPGEPQAPEARTTETVRPAPPQPSVPLSPTEPVPCAIVDEDRVPLKVQ